MLLVYNSFITRSIILLPIYTLAFTIAVGTSANAMYA